MTINPATIPRDARLYLRPVQFADTPVGRDGEVVRLAGGLLWFAAYELIAVSVARRIVQATIPVAALPALIAALSESQAERLSEQAERIAAQRPAIHAGDRVLRFDQPLVMGILNMTPDSFSDGGRHLDDVEGAANAGFDMSAAGAAIIDVGGESTRPGSETVWEGDEIRRTVPVVERLAASGVAVSIDTRKAGVMEAALAAGAHIVNDVAALLWDDRAVGVVARAGCPVVLMHSPDPKKGPHGGTGHADPLIEIYDWLEARIDAVTAAGVDRRNILIDPGIGFGKTMTDNLALLNGLALFHALGCPILLGASRKRLIGALSNEAPADQRLGGSLALALKGAELGAQLLRVHDVFETAQALRVWRGMKDAALTGPMRG
ncbi:dihydropteroate synthase [Stakelama pacifica]|uniref:dihydropteroate synthase n=1 Tax=Stakelama pacifica TaxID=517720 RepID=A0A4R6FDM7_9SPHN|nr:dihydropteroate synthase [Stakelama pacifica]TDN78385.1 dihydropteroate synthase [Stakelama pacifica]GGO99471.1 dihydropteroate synthase [Stakelama pacifica]